MDLNIDEIKLLNYLYEHKELEEKDYYKFDSTDDHSIIRSLYQKKCIMKSGVIPRTLAETKRGVGRTKIWIDGPGKATVEQLRKVAKEQIRREYIDNETLKYAKKANEKSNISLFFAALSAIGTIGAFIVALL